MATVKVLMCNKYKYPERKGEPISIKCKKWNTDPKCSGEFHGITKDFNRTIFVYGPIFQVVEVDDNPNNFVILGNNEMVKFNKGRIIYQSEDGYNALKMIFGSYNEMFNWEYFSWATVKPEYATEEIQLFFIKNNMYSLNYLYNPSYNVMREALKKNGRNIDCIKPEYQTEELQLLAIETYSQALYYCHNPSDKVKQLHKKLWLR